MRPFILGLSMAFGIVGAALPQNVMGKYSVGGKNLDGSAYDGAAQITPNGSTCRIVWKTGQVTSEGVCMVSDKTLAAFYKLGSDYGLIIYEIQDDGSLKGQWTVAGKNGRGSEVLKPLK